LTTDDQQSLTVERPRQRSVYLEPQQWERVLLALQSIPNMDPEWNRTVSTVQIQVAQMRGHS
jgi:hypothetical protein